MRTTNGWMLATTLAFGLVAIGHAGAAGMQKQKTTVHVAKPVKAGRAKAPPAGAKPTTALHVNMAMKWKTDPKSHSVFAVGEHNQLWFMDPTTGWPYTIDAKGYVYTADPSSGAVYNLGKLSKWSGAAPYFFTLWDYADGSYRVPSMNTYVTIYEDNSAPVYTYDTAYSEVWEYQDYFSSDQFSEETVDTTEEVTEETTTTTEETTTEEHSSESSSEEHSSESATEEHEEHSDAPAEPADEPAEASDDSEH